MDTDTESTKNMTISGLSPRVPGADPRNMYTSIRPSSPKFTPTRKFTTRASIALSVSALPMTQM